MNLSRMLLKNNAESFSFNLSIDEEDIVYNKIEKHINKPLKEITSLAFAKKMRIDGVDKLNLALIDCSDKVCNHLHVLFIYNVSNFPQPPKGVDKPDIVLNMLIESDKEYEIFCSAKFIYKASSEKSLISLPISLFRSNKQMFNKVIGITLLNDNEENDKSEISISTDENGDITHEIAYKQKINFKERTEIELLNKALSISKGFII